MAWANAETKMNLYNVRLHLRVLRRTSMAVCHPANPEYKDSGLYFWDRNEEIFGRKSPQTFLQETGRSFDAFLSAVPNLDDLRAVSEAIHVMFLRGYNIKPGGKQAAETAKAILIATKVPNALLPRFSEYAGLMTMYESYMSFHKAHPAGLDLDGNSIKIPNTEWPIFAAASAEKLSQDILLPLMLFKKHGSCIGNQTPLGIPFIKDMLPELDALYQQDLMEQKAQENLSRGDAEGSRDTDMAIDETTPITEEEATVLKKDHDEAKECVYLDMAETFMGQNIVLSTWSDNVEQVLSGQPMISSQAARLWWFNAGTDTTKDPAKKMNVFRMKSLPDEAHVDLAVDMTARYLTEADTSVFVSGRNQLFHRDVRKQIKALRPKVSAKELEISPDESQMLPVLRVETNNSGSIDVTDPYWCFVKNGRVWKSRKSAQRRFVPGHTAFRTMSGVPIITRENMIQVPYQDRETMFKNVQGSDKWGSRTSTGAGQALAGKTGESISSESEADVAEEPKAVDTTAMVPLFYMELHSRVCRLNFQVASYPSPCLFSPELSCSQANLGPY